MAERSVAVSAPGKVLLVGGYVVLDRKFTCLTFGLNARVFVHVRSIAATSGVKFSEITVRSPQFQHAVWEYGYRLSNDEGGARVTELRPDADLRLKRNVFVETALAYALSYVSILSPGTIEPTSITILADNDYYSTSSDELISTERFHKFDVPLAQANKTGLGSSAALITAFIGATLSFYLGREQFDLSVDSGKQILHNLAQAAHCAAQGKVGSGFDVASAVYGGCLYRKFSPALLESYGEPGSAHFARKLYNLVSETGPEATRWDTEVLKDAVKMPKGLRLVMCDVSCGTETPAMVKRVLAWRANGGDDAERLLEDLHSRSRELGDELNRLANSPSPEDYGKLSECFTRYRERFRELGEKSEVPVEPPAQTQLLDACTAVNGVVGGLTPGSGGYDAIALIIEDRQEVEDALSRMLADFKFDYKVGERDPKVSVMRVKQETDGVRVEEPTDFDSWTV